MSDRLEEISVGNCPCCGHFPTQCVAVEVEGAPWARAYVARDTGKSAEEEKVPDAPEVPDDLRSTDRVAAILAPAVQAIAARFGALLTASALSGAVVQAAIGLRDENPESDGARKIAGKLAELAELLREFSRRNVRKAPSMVAAADAPWAVRLDRRFTLGELHGLCNEYDLALRLAGGTFDAVPRNPNADRPDMADVVSALFPSGY